MFNNTTTAAAATTTTEMPISSSDNELEWYDYLEVVILVILVVLGLVGNLTVLRAAIRIRTFSRQISCLYCALVCADLLICGSRIPTTIYIVFSPNPNSHPAVAMAAATLNSPSVTLTSPTVTLTSPSVTLASPGVTLTSPSSTLNSASESGGMLNVNDGGDVGGGGGGGGGGGAMEVDIACEIWAINMALLLTVIWLHLVISFQRLAIIFFFMKYRKVFTSSLTNIIVVSAFMLGFVIVYTPLRAVGLPMERAGRGACRVESSAHEGVLIARSVCIAVLALAPLIATAVCHFIVMKSVWLARELEVRTGATTDYNRVVVVGVVRISSLLLTFLPVCILHIVDVRGVSVPNEAYRYVGHFMWLQSVISPFVTLQDNDFRDKMMVPNKHAPNLERNGVNRDVTPGEADVVNSDGGHDDNQHRERNIQEMKKDRPRYLQRGISFITSADLRSIKGSGSD